MTEYTLVRAINPVGDIVFSTENREHNFVFKPKDDITPIELAHLMHLMTIASTAHRFGVSWQPFVEEHKLWRHLEEKL